MACQMSGVEQREAQQLGCVVILLGFMMCALFYERMMQRLDLSGLRMKKYDMKTCTAADYAVRVDITEEWYE